MRETFGMTVVSNSSCLGKKLPHYRTTIEVATGMREAGDEAIADGIGRGGHDQNRASCTLQERKDSGCVISDDVDHTLSVARALRQPENRSQSPFTERHSRTS